MLLETVKSAWTPLEADSCCRKFKKILSVYVHGGLPCVSTQIVKTAAALQGSGPHISYPQDKTVINAAEEEGDKRCCQLTSVSYVWKVFLL